VLPFGGRRYVEPNAIANAIGYAKFRSRSHDAVIRVYDEAGDVIEKHEHAGRFQRAVGGVVVLAGRVDLVDEKVLDRRKRP
jgi:hypothetical protein